MIKLMYALGLVALFGCGSAIGATALSSVAGQTMTLEKFDEGWDEVYVFDYSGNVVITDPRGSGSYTYSYTTDTMGGNPAEAYLDIEKGPNGLYRTLTFTASTSGEVFGEVFYFGDGGDGGGGGGGGPLDVDLMITSTSPTSKTVLPDELVSITVKTKNNGKDKALADAGYSDFETCLYLNTTTDFETVDEWLLDEVAEYEFSSLKAGSSDSRTYTFSAPSSAGTYYIRAKADGSGSVTESNEDNNWGDLITLIVFESDVIKTNVYDLSELVDLWDLSGVYAEGLLGMDFMMAQDGKGKLVGTGTWSGPVSNNTVDALFVVKGKLKTEKDGSTSLKLKLKHKGIAVDAGVTNKFVAQQTITAVVDPDELEMNGEVKTSVKMGKLKIKQVDVFNEDLPVGMDGSAVLTTETTEDMKGKVFGSGLCELSNLEEISFEVKGTRSTKTDTVKMKIKGRKETDDSGAKLSVEVSGDYEDIEALKGKIMGQKIKVE